MRRILFVIMFASITSLSYALDVATHKAINENIARNNFNGFSLDSYVISNLGLATGVTTSLNSLELWKWLRDGGLYEDMPPESLIPYRRSRNHFHNPLKTMNEAYYSDMLAFCAATDNIFQISAHCPKSAILWAQGPQNSDIALGVDLNPGGDWSWKKTRENFYAALSSAVNSDRDTKFAETFRGIGQLMHLVQDMSVPEHTRNAFHAIYAYEEWVRDDSRNSSNVLTQAYSDPVFFNMNTLISMPSVFGTAAPVPIANLFDTNLYDGTNPQITTQNLNSISNPAGTVRSDTIGLSEYTNANFVSKDTLFASSFPYPALNSTDTESYKVKNPFTNQDMDRPYYVKRRDGATGYRLAGVPFLKFKAEMISEANPNETIHITKEIPIMDSEVYQGYAALLLPRAVGYSAALLNYFFRGSIEIGLPDDGVYATTGPDGTFTKIKLKARNSTANNEAMTNGTIQLVVKYKTALTDPFQMHNDCTEKTDYYSYIVVPEASNLTSLPTTSTTLTFDLTGNAIPLWATDVYLQIVYKGQLGNEANAVAVGFKDISEPTPLDLRNDMDWVCINGTNYPTGSAEANAAFIAALGYVPNLPSQTVLNDYLAFTQIDAPRVVTPTYYHAYFVSIDPGYYGRIYVLGDNDAFWYSNQRNSLPATGYYGTYSLLNQDETIDGIEYCNYSPFSTQRGLTVWDWYYIALPAYPSSSVCPPINGPLKEQAPVPVTIRQLQ